MGTPADIGADYESLRLSAGRYGNVRAWWIPNEKGSTPVIFFPSRRGNISFELQTLQYLRRLGVSLLAVDYPGYGESEGKTNERGCYAAAEAAWQAITQQKGYAPEEVVLYGRSLGSAVAVRLAARVNCKGLVFHGGFSSLPDIASCYLPSWGVKLLCRIQLNSEKYIVDCRCPMLVLHSEADQLIPLRLAARVFELAQGPKRMIVLDGKHQAMEWVYDAEVRRCWQAMISGAALQWSLEAEHETVPAIQAAMEGVLETSGRLDGAAK
jgi:hypothetical protein